MENLLHFEEVRKQVLPTLSSADAQCLYNEYIFYSFFYEPSISPHYTLQYDHYDWASIVMVSCNSKSILVLSQNFISK